MQSLKVGQLVLLASGSTWAEELWHLQQVSAAADLGPIGADVIEQLAMSTVNPLTALLMLTSYTDVAEGHGSRVPRTRGGWLRHSAGQTAWHQKSTLFDEGLAEELMAKGADVVLVDGPNLQLTSQKRQAMRLCVGTGPVGGDTYSRLADSLGYSGTLVTFGVLSGKPATLDTRRLIGNDIRLRGFGLQNGF